MRYLTPFEAVTKAFSRLFEGGYNFSFQLLNNAVEFNRYYEDKEKLSAVLSNPALLKIISLQCDLFSLGHVYLKDQDNNIIEDDSFLNWFKAPNPMQNQKQFLWDYMFWTMLGNAYLYIDSDNLNLPNNNAYFLTPYKIDFPEWLDQDRDKLIFSNSRLNEIKNTTITYTYDDGTTFKFPLRKLIIGNDLTNGVGNFYKGASRIDALYKIISNSEHSLDSKNINIRYSSKFLVGSESGSDKLPLTTDEKDIIANRMNKDRKQVYPMSSMAKIQRFVSDIGALKLDESYLADYFLIGNMYNIPRDVLEAYNSATYENQEKARGAHVSYTLEPKGEELCSSFNRYFKYNEQRLKICIDWKHLPFMQVFEKDKSELMRNKSETMRNLIELGYTLEEAQQLCEM